MKKRIDMALVEWGYFESRNKAQAAIEEGLVFIQEKQVRKSNQEVDFKYEIKNCVRIESGKSNRYVSRGGLKMEGALAKTGLNVSGIRVLDVGISTGGFSDCLLQNGAKEIVGIDVGHKQIHPSLLENKNLHVYEGLHVHDLDSAFFRRENLDPVFDLVVCDVSFISLRYVLPHVIPFLKLDGLALFLVKPQFELSKEDLGKGGVVKDNSHFQKVEKLIRSLFEDFHFKILDYFESSITGSDGNREFFIYAKKSKEHSGAN